MAIENANSGNLPKPTSSCRRWWLRSPEEKLLKSLKDSWNLITITIGYKKPTFLNEIKLKEICG